MREKSIPIERVLVFSKFSCFHIVLLVYMSKVCEFIETKYLILILMRSSIWKNKSSRKNIIQITQVRIVSKRKDTNRPTAILHVRNNTINSNLTRNCPQKTLEFAKKANLKYRFVSITVKNKFLPWNTVC